MLFLEEMFTVGCSTAMDGKRGFVAKERKKSFIRIQNDYGLVNNKNQLSVMYTLGDLSPGFSEYKNGK